MRELVARLRVASTLEAPGVARRWMAELLTDGVHTEATEDAVLLVSELVSNVMMHTDALDMEIIVTTDGSRLRCAVLDDEPDLLPVLRDDQNPAVGGMGLQIVREVAELWGTQVADTSKAVWFELRLPVAASSEPEAAAEPTATRTAALEAAVRRGVTWTVAQVRRLLARRR